MAPHAMNDVFAAMDEETKQDQAVESLDLTPRSPCMNIFGCCLPKGNTEVSSKAIVGDETDNVSEKKLLVTESKPREFDLPELDDEKTTKETQASQPPAANVVTAFWQMLISLVFFNWLEEHAKGNKKIHDKPSPKSAIVT